MAKMRWFDWALVGLTLTGALNWGLIAAFNFNLVTAILGVGKASTMVYWLVGFAAILSIFRLIKK